MTPSVKDLQRLFRLMISSMFVPRFRFDKSLFCELIRRVNAEHNIVAPEHEPEVEFTMGPVDGTLGQFNAQTMSITIDVLEIFLFSQDKHRPPTYEEAKQHFDDEVTRVLAHEGGHWQLEKRMGWIPRVEKLLLHFGFLGLGALLVLVAYFIAAQFVTAVLLPNILGSSHWLGSVFGWGLAIVTVVGFYAVFGRVITRLFTIWRILTTIVAYHICYHERYARQFEKRVEADSTWRKVIEVD
ncbi:MAG: hypothetical protein HUU49_04360 [Candidatus Buchananbacteria bacterium]|nr:hypothetical protein [Candidatus Buchananbacteria bacterium]